MCFGDLIKIFCLKHNLLSHIKLLWLRFSHHLVMDLEFQNNGVIFNKTTSLLQSTANALVLACYFPLRKHSLMIFSFYNAALS